MRARLAVVLLASLGTVVPASAETTDIPSDPSDASAVRQVVAESDTVVIRVGRAIDLEGKPVYADRSNFSGMAGVTIFSRRPVAKTFVQTGKQSPLIAPLARAAVSSGFGMRAHPVLGTRRFHAGVDLAAPAGSPIRATQAGVVTKAGWNGGYGLLVSIGHGGGQETRYGHLSQLRVGAGQTVRQGDVVGFVGSTGMSTGPHLHYEMRVDGRAVRPDR